jgi:RNA polymerase sigma factor (sigma-70 family)
MVLGVCQSVLHNLHDAEDAFQAAFLVLAQKAGSIHRREAVCGWLHRVAYHLAVDAQASAARRRVHEQRAAIMPPADPLLDMSLRELRGIVNEELQRLPEQFRAPLVLCGLEEKTVEEAARLLGWTKGTVKGRLQRGREQLRQRLRRRGLDVSAGLLAIAFATSSASARISTSLTAGTLRAALRIAAGEPLSAGVISAQVAALVQGANAIMFTNKAKVVIVLLLALSAGVAGLAAVLAANPQEDAKPAKAAKPENHIATPTTARTDSKETIAVRGQVLDPDGKPLAGAEVYFAKTTLEGRELSRKATSGPDGRFRFSILNAEADSDDVNPRRNPWASSHLSQPPLYWPGEVMAVAPGHGCDWAEVGSGAKELTLRLVKDLPIRGRILDPDGKPLPSAKLTLLGVADGKGDIGSYLDAVRQGKWWGYQFVKGWAGPPGGLPAVLTTGADGRFKLDGVGGERIVYFRLEGPGIATANLEVMTRAAETVAGAQGRRVYGAAFDYVATISRPIRGVIRDKDTRKPMAGVRVRVNSLMELFTPPPPCETVTDREGRYELLGLPRSSRYGLELKPVDGLYLKRTAELTGTPGLDALSGDIEMVQGGITVRGKVTDKDGKPIAHAQVDYHPFYNNPHVNKLAGAWHPCSEAIAGPDGSYTLTVLPGPGVMGISARNRDEYMPAWVTLQEVKDFFKVPLPPQVDEENLPVAAGNTAIGLIYPLNYNALVLLEPDAKEKELVKNVVLEAPREVKGRVVDPDGRPLTGVTISGLTRFVDETLKGAEFTVHNVNPRAKRQLVFHHKEKNLGFFLKELAAEKSDPLTIQLQRCGSVSGRLVDQDGVPVAGFRIPIWRKRTANFGEALQQEVVTDKEGRFRAEGLVPGKGYGAMPSPAAQFSFYVVVESGEQKDLGDIKARLNK